MAPSDAGCFACASSRLLYPRSLAQEERPEHAESPASQFMITRSGMDWQLNPWRLSKHETTSFGAASRTDIDHANTYATKQHQYPSSVYPACLRFFIAFALRRFRLLCLFIFVLRFFMVLSSRMSTKLVRGSQISRLASCSG